MITVKLYGLLRIESGIKEKQLEATSVKEVLEQLTNANKRSKLTDGDTVVLMSPVAGG